MTPFQIITLSAFVLICILVTYRNTINLVKQKQEADTYALALENLVDLVGKLPESVLSEELKQVVRVRAIVLKERAAKKK